MLLLFIPIYLIIWRSGSYGLNELQLSEDDFMYYYSTDIHINMLHVAVFVTVSVLLERLLILLYL